MSADMVRVAIAPVVWELMSDAAAKSGRMIDEAKVDEETGKIIVFLDAEVIAGLQEVDPDLEKAIAIIAVMEVYS